MLQIFEVLNFLIKHFKMFPDKDDGIQFIDPLVCLKRINLCEIFMMDDRYVLKLFAHYGIIKNGGLKVTSVRQGDVARQARTWG